MATQVSLLHEPLLSLIPRVVFLFACPSVQIPWVGGGSLYVSSEGWEGVGGDSLPGPHSVRVSWTCLQGRLGGWGGGSFPLRESDGHHC